VGVLGVMVIWIEIESWVIWKGVAKRWSKRRGGVSRGRNVETTGFWGPCLCLGLVPLLSWRVLLSGIAEDWECLVGTIGFSVGCKWDLGVMRWQIGEGRRGKQSQGERVYEKGPKEYLVGEQWIVAKEKGKKWSDKKIIIVKLKILNKKRGKIKKK
jgi:hypothetical protein